MIARADRRKDRPQTHPILTTRASVTKSRKWTERANCLEHGWHSWALSACQKCWSAPCACGHCRRVNYEPSSVSSITTSKPHDYPLPVLAIRWRRAVVTQASRDLSGLNMHSMRSFRRAHCASFLCWLIGGPRTSIVSMVAGERERQRGQDRMILRVMLAFLLLARITSTTNGAKNKKMSCLCSPITQSARHVLKEALECTADTNGLSSDTQNCPPWIVNNELSATRYHEAQIKGMGAVRAVNAALCELHYRAGDLQQAASEVTSEAATRRNFFFDVRCCRYAAFLCDYV